MSSPAASCRPPWSDLPEDGRGELVWRSAADDDPETLYRLWDEAVGRSRAVLREVLHDRRARRDLPLGWRAQHACAACWST